MKTSSTRVGVLVTCYNSAPWIQACVDSIMAQTRPPDEIVIFDDGSDDGSRAILRGYGDKIRLIEGSRREGPRSGFARQGDGVWAALQASTAEHLHLLDGDDLYLPGRLAAYERAWAGRSDALMVQGPMGCINAEGMGQGEWRIPGLAGKDLERQIRHTQHPLCFYLTSALAFRRDFLLRVMPLDFSDGHAMAIDTRLAFAAVMAGAVLTLDEVATLYRIREGSIAALCGLRSGPLYRTTQRHVAFYNITARRIGRPTLSLWRNPVWWRQRLRGFMPAALGDRLAVWLWRIRQTRMRGGPS